MLSPGGHGVALRLRPEALKFGFGFEAALIAPAQEADAARA
jgi:hypothetical protein